MNVSEEVKHSSVQIKVETKKIESNEETVKVQNTQPTTNVEAPKATAPAAAPQNTDAPAPAPSKPKFDFMSRLVSSKDASKKVANIPVARLGSAPGAQKTVSAEVKAEPVAAAPIVATVVRRERPVVELEEIEPTETKPAEPVVAVAAVVESELDKVVEGADDMFTDYSPEAVVRRAAWNRGYRCRRNYGALGIPVAFVKSMVALYVSDQPLDSVGIRTLEERGWKVLWFKASDVTDGKAEADVIEKTIKQSLREMKASKKKAKAKKAKKIKIPKLKKSAKD